MLDGEACWLSYRKASKHTLLARIEVIPPFQHNRPPAQMLSLLISDQRPLDVIPAKLPDSLEQRPASNPTDARPPND
jgi:hypothetical protein